jgi:RNA polymerase primary sigma factor
MELRNFKRTSFTSREGIVDMYLRDIRSTSSDADKEKELIDIYYDENTSEEARLKARNDIVTMNEKFIFSIAKALSKGDMDLAMDLNSVGNIGFIEAFDHYEKDSENRFCTFAKYYIVRAINGYLNNENLLVRPTNNMSIVPKARKIAEDFEKTELRKPTIGEISDILEDQYGITLSKKTEIAPISYNRIDSGPDSQEEDDDRFLAKNMEFDSQTAISNDYDLQAETDGLKYEIKRAMAGLSVREQNVIRLAFGIDSPYYKSCNNQEIGKILGLTPERIRQIKDKALLKIKSALENKVTA